MIFSNQDNAAIVGTHGTDVFSLNTSGDGNDCAIDFKSDPTSLFIYTGSQNFGGGVIRTVVSKMTGVLGEQVALTLPG
jgi:hypothetical protein